jgi:hypothetical protein
VEDTARVARLVVWATGLSEGLHWELDFLIKNVPPEKLVIWAHPHLLHLSEARREKEWRAFRASLGGLFPKPLPERLGAVRFFYFKADQEPVGVASSWVFGANARALRAALDAIGLKNRRRGGIRRWSVHIFKKGRRLSGDKRRPAMAFLKRQSVALIRGAAKSSSPSHPSYP